MLDKSGSMQTVEEAVVAGYNDYLGELRAQGGETRSSLTTFDTSFEHVWVGEPLEKVPGLDHCIYRPDGMTALYDAIAHTVLRTDQRLQADGRGDENVLVVVMTDGLENVRLPRGSVPATTVLSAFRASRIRSASPSTPSKARVE